MKRDMSLVRKILLTIEEQHVDTGLFGLTIESYDLATIGYHCNIMYEAGLIASYKPTFGGNRLLMFTVGGLTWDGQDYLESVRDEEIWKKTLDTIENNKLPKDLNTIASVAGNFFGGIISSMNS